MASKLPPIVPPDLAAARARLAAFDAALAHPLPPDPYADGCQGEREREADRIALREARLRQSALVKAMAKRRKNDLAMLGMAAPKLKWDETILTLKCLTLSHGRTDSRAGLTEPERRVMLAEAKRAGWRPQHAGGRIRTLTAAESKEETAAKIRALLLDAGRDDAYANAICKSRWGIARWEWLAYGVLTKLLQMLVIDQERRALTASLEAIAQGRPWDSALTPGERAAGVGERIARKLIDDDLAEGPSSALQLTVGGLKRLRARQARMVAAAQLAAARQSGAAE